MYHLCINMPNLTRKYFSHLINELWMTGAGLMSKHPDRHEEPDIFVHEIGNECIYGCFFYQYNYFPIQCFWGGCFWAAQLSSLRCCTVSSGLGFQASSHPTLIPHTFHNSSLSCANNVKQAYSHQILLEQVHNLISKIVASM